jgi:hypothetical protein
MTEPAKSISDITREMGSLSDPVQDALRRMLHEFGVAARRAPAVTDEMVEAGARAKYGCCNRGTLHATMIPPKWKGERCWIVALHGEVVGNDEKFGCLKREIIGEAL